MNNLLYKVVNLDNAIIAEFGDYAEAFRYAERAVETREHLWLAIVNDRREILHTMTVLK